MAALRLGGLITGIDTETIIQKILDVERIPIRHLQAQKKLLQVKSDAIASIKGSLSSLKSAISNLRDSAFFLINKATSSNTSVASATVGTTAARGNYSVVVKSVASSSILKSGASLGVKVAQPIDTTVELQADGAYGHDLKYGTFSINGVTITIDAATRLGGGGENDLFVKILNATGIVGNFDSAEFPNKIHLHSDGGPIMLGASTDTSNFLILSHLYTPSGTDTRNAVSATTVGSLYADEVLAGPKSRLIPKGVDPEEWLSNDSFTVNGVTVTVDKNVDTLQSILDRITASTAGVYASYDAYEDRVVLTSKTTGSFGITVTGTDERNLAARLNLLTGSGGTSQLFVGKDTVVTVNGGMDRYSADNIISPTESGITGLTLTVLNTTPKAADGTTDLPITVNVASDTATIQSAVSNFVSQYNSVQNIISSYTAVPNKNAAAEDPKSVLAGDSSVFWLSHSLRKSVMSAVGSGTVRMLEDIGIAATGDNNLLTFSSPTALMDALAQHPNEVVRLFTDSTYGIMARLGNFIDGETNDIDGSLTVSIRGIAENQRRADDSIANIERRLSTEEDRLVTAFAAMEAFQAKSSSILSYFNNGKDK